MIERFHSMCWLKWLPRAPLAAPENLPFTGRRGERSPCAVSQGALCFLSRQNRSSSNLGCAMSSDSVDTSTIVTHNGTFHCDEALAVYMIQAGIKEFESSRVVRTRDNAKIQLAGIVVDVGGVYSPERMRFDHHQRGFSEFFSPGHVTKLSSAGLIYKHFGKDIIRALTSIDSVDSVGRALSAVALSDSDLEDVYQRLYTAFVEGIDAIDNGINQFDTDLPPRYQVSTHLSARVGGLNPCWNRPHEKDDDLFKKAVELTGQEFRDALFETVHSWLPGRSIIAEALEMRFKTDPSGQIIALQSYAPWKSHLPDMEATIVGQNSALIAYVIYPDQNEMWRIQCVAEAPNSFNSRIPLPEPWRGLRDEELDQIVGHQVPSGCTFVHNSGFIGGHRTREGALAMGQLSLLIADGEKKRKRMSETE